MVTYRSSEAQQQRNLGVGCNSLLQTTLQNDGYQYTGSERASHHEKVAKNDYSAFL